MTQDKLARRAFLDILSAHEMDIGHYFSSILEWHLVPVIAEKPIKSQNIRATNQIPEKMNTETQRCSSIGPKRQVNIPQQYHVAIAIRQTYPIGTCSWSSRSIELCSSLWSSAVPGCRCSAGRGTASIVDWISSELGLGFGRMPALNSADWWWWQGRNPADQCPRRPPMSRWLSNRSSSVAHQWGTRRGYLIFLRWDDLKSFLLFLHGHTFGFIFSAFISMTNQ